MKKQEKQHKKDSKNSLILAPRGASEINKLNLGCGRDIKEGYINLDIAKIEGVDVVHDIEKGHLPFKDDFFEEVYICHTLEHLGNFTEIMKELYRVCKKDAIIKIKSPYFASMTAFGSPTHKCFFSLGSFDYFLPNNYNKHIIGEPKFLILKKKLKFTRKDWIINRPIEWFVNSIRWAYERFFPFIIPMQEIYFELRVLK